MNSVLREEPGNLVDQFAVTGSVGGVAAVHAQFPQTIGERRDTSRRHRRGQSHSGRWRSEDRRDFERSR